MDEFILYNYAVMKNGRQCRLVCDPQMTWQDALEAIEEMREKFATKKQEADDKEAEKKECEPLEITS